MVDKYILVGHTPKPVPDSDLMRWAEWFEIADRVVAKTMVEDVEVSTVFLAIDHAFGGKPPLLFETMVFGGKLHEDIRRCTTWEQAEDQHKQMVKRVKRYENKGT
ncbi:MAG: hypothetical protein NVS1B10_08430 [Candidatus Saccharimonadales bacterium]